MRTVKGKRIYGAWAGSPKGTPENTSYCIVEVWPTGGGWIPYQCQRKRGYGLNRLYCKQHAKMKAAEQDD